MAEKRKALRKTVTGTEQVYFENTADNTIYDDTNTSVAITTVQGALKDVRNKEVIDGIAISSLQSTVNGQATSISNLNTNKLDKKPDGTNLLIDNNNKITQGYLPDYILGQLMFGGTVAAGGITTPSTNFKTKYGVTTFTLTASNAVGHDGDYFIVSSAGTIASRTNCQVGDWIVSDGTTWQKIDNTDAVKMVNGHIGNVETYQGVYTTGDSGNVGDIYKNNSDSLLYLCVKGEAAIIDNPNADLSKNTNFQIFGKDSTADIAALSNLVAQTTTSITNIENGTTTVGKANKLATARIIALSNDVLGTVAFDGSANVAMSTNLSTTGIAAGTYSALTVDTKGRATAGGQLIEWGTSAQTTPSASLAVGGLFFELKS